MVDRVGGASPFGELHISLVGRECIVGAIAQGTLRYTL